jgi:uncharacterized protein (DUF488 family)
MKIYTIGFTKKTANQFFELLKANGIECMMDIRLHPDGQLSGFSKKEDLSFFLKELIGCDYKHMPRLAPEDDILKAYRTDHDWGKYEIAFETLMDKRGIPDTLDKTLFEEKACCLLCSEDTPKHCHRPARACPGSLRGRENQKDFIL